MTTAIANGPACDSEGCGQPTYEFASGSIWCPNEDAHPGGRFMRRVAFERAPRSLDEARERITRRAAPQSKSPVYARPVPYAPASPLGEGKAPLREEPGFDGGFDAFVRSES